MAVAEHESAQISARVKAAMAASRARGVEPYRGGRQTPEAIRVGVEASRAARLRRTREAYAEASCPYLHRFGLTVTTIEFDRCQSRVAEQFDGLHDLCTLKHCERLVLCCIPRFLRQKVVATDGAFRS